MNKLIFAALIAVFALGACNNDKQEEKALQADVISIHEKVMNLDDQAEMNKMKLDTLVIKAKLAKADTLKLSAMRAQLLFAQDAMGFWMRNFNPDYTGKSHEDVMKYLNDQRAKVKKIDSLLSAGVKQSTEYLKNPATK